MRNRVYHILYGIMVATVFFIVVFLHWQYDGTSIIRESFDLPMDFSSGWVLEDGSSVEMSKLHHLEEIGVYEEFSVFCDIPADIEEGNHICFRSKNVYFQVYVDGVLVYDPYVPENKLYTKSSGTRFNYVPITSEDAGKQVEMRITKVYDSGKSSIDHIVLGEPARAIMDTVEEKLISFITCILTLFVGVLLIIVDIPINMRAQKNHELLYLGMFSVSVATWCLAETNLLQFYMGDSRTMQMVSCCMLMLISIPMTLYLDAAFGFRKRGAMMAMVGVSFLSFVVAMVLHVTKIADVHETLHFSHIVLVLSAVVLFYTIIRNTFIFGKSKSRNVYRVLRGIGLCGLSIATVIDIYRYYTGSSSDTAMFVRIGLLIFIVCFGSSSLEKTINAVKLGVQMEIVSQLAYKDGLTRIGNRTAFEERLVDLEKEKDELDAIGIVIFDVNDLKFINDNFGHRTGDKMLVESANLIENAFTGEEGECFRIGGDEFAVILSGDKVLQQYENGIASFRDILDEYNAQPDKDFRISIAHGFAVYNQEEQGKMLMNIYQQADLLMYENKRQIKGKQTPPEEFYQTGVL